MGLCGIVYLAVGSNGYDILAMKAPALTAISVAASVALRRLGRKQLGFWIQFIAPAMFGLLILLTSI